MAEIRAQILASVAAVVFCALGLFSGYQAIIFRRRRQPMAWPFTLALFGSVCLHSGTTALLFSWRVVEWIPVIPFYILSTMQEYTLTLSALLIVLFFADTFVEVTVSDERFFTVRALLRRGTGLFCAVMLTVCCVMLGVGFLDAPGTDTFANSKQFFVTRVFFGVGYLAIAGTFTAVAFALDDKLQGMLWGKFRALRGARTRVRKKIARTAAYLSVSLTIHGSMMLARELWSAFRHAYVDPDKLALHDFFKDVLLDALPLGVALFLLAPHLHGTTFPRQGSIAINVSLPNVTHLTEDRDNAQALELEDC